METLTMESGADGGLTVALAGELDLTKKVFDQLRSACLLAVFGSAGTSPGQRR